MPRQGDFFTDPSTASITCVTDGPVKLDSNVAMGKEGEEVFSEAKSLLFKVGSAIRTTGIAAVVSSPPSPPRTLPPLHFAIRHLIQPPAILRAKHQSVKVRRVVDKESNNIVYVSYSQRLSQDKNDKGRFKSSLCAVHVTN